LSSGRSVIDQQRPITKRTRQRRKRAGSSGLGDRIRKFRVRLGMSQVALAQRVGRSEGWLVQVENERALTLHPEVVVARPDGRRAPASGPRRHGWTSPPHAPHRRHLAYLRSGRQDCKPPGSGSSPEVPPPFPSPPHRLLRLPRVQIGRRTGLVGRGGFEPPISWSQTRRFAGLSHRPPI
jgi:DNA-binding XRE family transcriptional regulator